MYLPQGPKIYGSFISKLVGNRIKSGMIVEDETGVTGWWPTYLGAVFVDGSAAFAAEGISLAAFVGIAGSSTPCLINLYDSSLELCSGYLAEADAVWVPGAELFTSANCTNPTNEADATLGWTNNGMATFDSIDTDPQIGTYHLHLLADSNNDGVSFSVTTVIGKLYKLVIYSKKVAGDSHRIMIGAGVGSTSVYQKNVASISWIATTVYFVAETTTTYITVEERGENDNAEIYIDNTSVKEVTALGADGCHIVSAKNGSTQNWASKSGSFDYNDSNGYTFDIVTT